MQRLAENPLIQPADVAPSRAGYEVIGTFNAGVTRYHDEVLLLLRVAERPLEQSPEHVTAPVFNVETGELDLVRVRRDDPEVQIPDERVFHYRGCFYVTSISHLRLARSTDGIHFSIDPEPTLVPEAHTETFGLEDPRITQILDRYWITYKAVSDHGITTALAETTDFVNFTRHGVLFCPENLDVVLFPEPVNGAYAAWTRPVGFHCTTPAIWTASSPDLLHWGNHRPVLRPRPGLWDGGRVGASTVPFRTPAGWLEIYHGADPQHRYGAGVALIDPADAARVRARADEAILKPEAQYEIEGFFGEVVFPCGCDVRDDGTVMIYYGAADSVTCGALTTVDELLASVAQ